MQFGQDTLTRVTNARAAAVAAGAQGPAAQAQAENTLTATLRSLFAVVENYPDLKANQNVIALQEELTTTENKISFARQFYNDSVMTYNTRIQSFPANTIAGMFNFTARQFFEGEAADREVPQVDLHLQAPTVQLQQPVAPAAPAPAAVQQPAPPVAQQEPPAPPQQPPAPPQQ
jgi:LemA protein